MSAVCFLLSVCKPHPNSDGDEGPESRDDNEGDAQWLSKGQELNDFGYTFIIGFIRPVVFITEDAFPSVCQTFLKVC